MTNHKWEDNECVRCGIVRNMESWKLLMAITNHPPYDHYKYGRSYKYGIKVAPFTVKFIGFKRPECKTKKQSQ
jgi:hypothetical protein